MAALQRDASTAKFRYRLRFCGAVWLARKPRMVATVLGDELVSEHLALKTIRPLKGMCHRLFPDERREQEILLRNLEAEWWRLLVRSGQQEDPLQPEPCKSRRNRANRLENRCSSDIEASDETPIFFCLRPLMVVATWY